MSKLPFFKAAIVIGAVAMLSACGGNGDDDRPAATTSVPATASQSILGFISYLKELVVSSADTLEPVDVSAVTPPTSDTTEPEVVD